MADERPSDDEIRAWQRRIAGGANNRAWALAEQPQRSADEDAQMLHAAHAARHLWGLVGNETHVALADLLLGQVLALLKRGPEALDHAVRAQRHFAARDAAPWERALAEVVLAHACRVAGDFAGHRLHHAAASAAFDAIDDPEERAIVKATFDVVPKPA